MKWRLTIAAALITTAALAQTRNTTQPNQGVQPAYPVQHQCIDQLGRAVECQLSDMPGADFTKPFQVPSAEKRAQIVAISPNGDIIGHAAVAALGNSLVVKQAAGQLYGFNCSAITGSAAGYCVAYNGTTVPGTGALTGANVLDVCYFAASPAGCSLSRLPRADVYSNGIVILITSAATPFTYTTGTLTGYISADYK